MAEQRIVLFDHWIDCHRDALLDHSLTTSVYRVTV
jgi:hypothetical protein